jgi:Zn-finger nucleic acid-binding protein
MKCPNCNETLLIAERHNVEIDYCPQCRGVWLDKGELDKILDYADAQAPQTPQAPPQQPYYPDKSYDKDKHYDPYYGKKHKRKSFLGDFFDFD